jgi:hypothetical protein
MANTGLIKRIKDADKAEDKALGQKKEIVKRTAEKNTKEAKKIEHSDKRSAMFMINQATSQQSTPQKNAKKCDGEDQAKAQRYNEV